MVEYFDLARKLVIICTLYITFCTLVGIDTTSNSVCICLHYFLTRPRLSWGCWTNTTVLRMLELLIISRSHSIILTTVQLISVFAIVEVVCCECKPCKILVWYHSSSVGRVAWVCLLLLLVLEIAFHEGPYCCLIVAWTLQAVHVFVVNVCWHSQRRRWLRLTVTITTSLTILSSVLLATTNLS